MKATQPHRYAALALGSALILCSTAFAGSTADRDEYEADMPGTWKAASVSNAALGFAQVTVRLTAGSHVNGHAGSLQLAAAGGKTVCRARLVMLDPGYNSGDGFGDDALLA